jgi:hypothetical protein
MQVIDFTSATTVVESLDFRNLLRRPLKMIAALLRSGTPPVS